MSQKFNEPLRHSSLKIGCRQFEEVKKKGSMSFISCHLRVKLVSKGPNGALI